MIKSLENLGKYGKHFTAEDWKRVEEFIDSGNETLDRNFKILKNVFDDYQKEVKENSFLEEATIRFVYPTCDILENLLKDAEDESVEDIEQKLDVFLEDVREQLQKELIRHQKREKQILENGIKGTYDFFEHCLEELLENKLNQHINE